jgi:integrase
MNTTEARLQLSRARTACLIALAALTGMRRSELAELTHDCRLPPEQLGEGRLRYRLKGKVIKGRKLGGEHDQWVTVKQAYDTAGVAASLADPVKSTGHLFKALSFFTPYEWFVTWVNGPDGRRLGLAPIPEVPVSLRMLRRTLAVEMAHRGLRGPPRWGPVGSPGRVRPRGARGQDARHPRCLPRLPERYPAGGARHQ